MLPRRSEKLLQDTKSDPDTQVVVKGASRTHFLIIGLISILGLVGWWSRQRVSSSPQGPQSAVSALESVPRVPTNTFVDAIFGTVIFYRGDDLVSLDLPSLVSRTVVGVDQDRTQSIPASVPPTWSPDGRLLAVAQSATSLVVTEYDTGRYKGTFPLPAVSPTTTTRIAIDAANEVVSVAAISDASSTLDSLRFYSLYTQKELGVYPQCHGQGVWLTGVGFATSCAVGDAAVIGLIRFEPNSSVLTPLARSSKSLEYQVIDEYTPGVLLLKRTRGSTKDLVTLDTLGTIQAIPRQEYQAVSDIESIVDATKSLGDRIERELQTKPVIELTVASDNSFLIFQTEDGLFVARLDLKDPPYFIGMGRLPRIRPN